MENKEIVEKEVYIVSLLNPKAKKETNIKNILVEGASIDIAIKVVSEWLTHTGSSLVLSSITRLTEPLIRKA